MAGGAGADVEGAVEAAAGRIDRTSKTGGKRAAAEEDGS